MRQLASQRTFFDPPAEFGFIPDPRVGFNPLLLLAIERALAPPVVYRRNVFQPMRIVVVDPTLLGTNEAGEEIPWEPTVLPRALPPMADEVNVTPRQFHHRTVRGEILSDESGRLYEKLGRQIRPIHQLASGQFGEVIDLVPTSSSTQSSPQISVTKRSAEVDSQLDSKSSSEQSAFEQLRKEQPEENLKTPSHRKLFADPGQWRVVWWGEFKEILARQLAHPERLRDSYRLPCYVQVLETERVVSIDELAAVYKSTKEHHSPLYVLTDEIAAKLDLVLPLRPAPPLHVRREPDTLLPHERVFRLVVANDPTLDVSTVKNRLQSTDKTDVGNERSADLLVTKLTGAEPTLKETIPSRFAKEWEFKISREEALYDVNNKASLASVLREFVRRLRFIKTRSELRKWKALLSGKDADEQLWSVRPPAGALASQLVRDWAMKTLALGEYSQKMILEWEIFWRRRGL